MNNQLVGIRFIGFRFYEVAHKETRSTVISFPHPKTSQSLKSKSLICMC